jgi:hypothetical protein
MKVIVGLAVVAVLAALGTNWLRDKESSVVHHLVDPSLPGEVGDKVWTPVRHGHPAHALRLRFTDGRVMAVQCHRALGTYDLTIDHHFSFTRATPAIRRGCAASRLSGSLARATRVDVAQQGSSSEMTLAGGTHQHTVATFTSPRT